MKNKLLLTLLLTILAIGHLVSKPAIVNLNGDWRFKKANASEWLKASVPGSTHLDLMNNGLIEDPFYATNEEDVQWVGYKDWIYSRDFNVDKALLSNDCVELVMNGIDTYADVYINDILAAKCDNMHRVWRSDIKTLLKMGVNNIRVSFHSVYKEDFPKYMAAPQKLRAFEGNDQGGGIWLSLYGRKAGYNFGWDWGPRLLTTGIWRDIFIESWDTLKIDDVQISTKQIAKNALMDLQWDVKSTKKCEANLNIYCNDKLLKSQRVILEEGHNSGCMEFVVKNPELWWSNGLGSAHLYNFDIEIKTPDVVDMHRVVTGIRTIEIVRDVDEHGQSMYVKLNGKPVFMKGANYIPSDNFPTRVKGSKYDYIVKSAAASNMNMLRVWGGGIYESDEFYEACDRYGILVWQDMMFACGMFPANKEYLDNVYQEVADNVKRLRNHPCIALWNGNNENEIAYFAWGWNKYFNEYQNNVNVSNLKKLFYQTIPEAIQSVDKTRYYHPTSPSTGYNGIGHNMGDVHFWSVWKGGWLEEYTKPENIGRFMSEYGFQAYPEMSTIRKYVPENQMYLNSHSMLWHQRARQNGDIHFGNNMIKMYMSKYFNVPDDFDAFVYMSQLLQAEAVKIGIEAHRRAMPYCMGSLYWQINDCWPVVSWSSIDYYGRWKALQYFARNAFSNVLISPFKEGSEVTFNVISDNLVDKDLLLIITTMKLNGAVVYSKEIGFEATANSVTVPIKIEESILLANEEKNEVVVYIEIRDEGELLSSNLYYPVYSNQYNYPNEKPVINYHAYDGGVKMSISAKNLVRGVCLSIESDDQSHFSDNYFTLIPNLNKEIFVTTKLSVKELKSRLKVMSVNEVNAYQNK